MNRSTSSDRSSWRPTPVGRRARGGRGSRAPRRRPSGQAPPPGPRVDVAVDAGPGQGGGQLPHVDVHAATVADAGLGQWGRVEGEDGEPAHDRETLPRPIASLPARRRAVRRVTRPDADAGFAVLVAAGQLGLEGVDPGEQAAGASETPRSSRRRRRPAPGRRRRQVGQRAEGAGRRRGVELGGEVLVVVGRERWTGQPAGAGARTLSLRISGSCSTRPAVSPGSPPSARRSSATMMSSRPCTSRRRYEAWPRPAGTRRASTGSRRRAARSGRPA